MTLDDGAPSFDYYAEVSAGGTYPASSGVLDSLGIMSATRKGMRQ